MHSRVEILVHVAPVDPTRSNQTNLKSVNPREKMLEGLRSSPSRCLTAKEIFIIGTVEIKASVDRSHKTIYLDKFNPAKHNLYANY